jgi:hypothetical protein
MKLQKSFLQIGTTSLILLTLGFGCKKSVTDLTPSLSSNEIAQVTNSDSQDALADKTDQDIDKTIDALQNNGYKSANTISTLKSGTPLTITVDTEDSTTFPKLITMVFNNYVDSSGKENFIKNGEIDIVVTSPTNDKKLITRTQTFKNFSVSTDSSTVIVNGVRTVKRTAFTRSFTSTSTAKIFVVDSIIGALKYSVTSAGDTSSFTRVIAKQRTATLYYTKVAPLIWKNNINSDTLKFTGTVTGTNEKGYIYTKTVTSIDPITIVSYVNKPVITAGTMEYTVTDLNKVTSTYTLTFSESDKTLHKSQITVVNDKTFKTYTFERKLGRKFRKW